MKTLYSLSDSESGYAPGDRISITRICSGRIREHWMQSLRYCCS